MIEIETSEKIGLGKLLLVDEILHHLGGIQPCQ